MTGYKRLVVIFIILKQIKDADCGRQMHKGSRFWTVNLFPLLFPRQPFCILNIQLVRSVCVE